MKQKFERLLLWWKFHRHDYNLQIVTRNPWTRRIVHRRGYLHTNSRELAKLYMVEVERRHPGTVAEPVTWADLEADA